MEKKKKTLFSKLHADPHLKTSCFVISIYFFKKSSSRQAMTCAPKLVLTQYYVRELQVYQTIV